MDLSFFRRAEARFAARTPARLDFGLFVAALQAQRPAPPAPRVQRSPATLARLADPLAEILLAGPCWREAVAAQGGSFNPAFARQGAVN